MKIICKEVGCSYPSIHPSPSIRAYFQPLKLRTRQTLTLLNVIIFLSQQFINKDC